MHRSIARVLLLVACFTLFTSVLARAAIQDIDHPYFTSDEYKKNAQEITQKQAELQKLTTELAAVQNERKQFSFSRIDFIFQGLSFLPFFSPDYIIVILLLSVVLAAIYLLYMKKYNPAKWFILFKSKGNLRLLLKRIKDHNSLIVLLSLAVLLSPSIGLAGTDVLTDVKYYFFGNDVERGYVSVKYPKAGIGLPYSSLKDVRVYQKYENGSFEQQYDLLVHEFALGMPPKASDVTRLIEKVKTVENLGTVYGFVFHLNSATMKEVVQKRLPFLAKIRSDLKYTEVEIILANAKETNCLGLVGEDIAASVNQMVPEASGIAGTLRVANLLADVDPAKANELFDRVKYRFKEIIGDEDSESRFKSVYQTLSKTRSIYKPDDTFQLDDQAEGLKVLVAALFDSTDDRIASSIIKSLRLERTTHLNAKEYEILIDLWRKYRKDEVPAFFDLFVATFVKHGMSNISIFMNLASRLGYEHDAAADALIKQDSDYYGLRADQSTLITKEFLSFLSPEVLERNFEYLKTRTPQAKIILDTLFQKREDLFYNYLRYCYEKDPHILEDLSYENKLVGFSKWKFLVRSKSLENFRVPGSYYLAAKELSDSPPNSEKAGALLQQSADERLKSLITSENNLDDAGFLDELMLYHLYSKSGDPQGVERKSLLESSIALQTRGRMLQLNSALDSQIKTVRAEVQAVNSELSGMKGEKLSIQIRIWIATILVVIIGIYILGAFLLSVKYAMNAVASYSGTRVGLFVAVFAETFAKFLVAVPYFTLEAVSVVVLVQLFGFLRSRDGEYPNAKRSLAGYSEKGADVETSILKG